MHAPDFAGRAAPEEGDGCEAVDVFAGLDDSLVEMRRLFQRIGRGEIAVELRVHRGIRP